MWSGRAKLEGGCVSMADSEVRFLNSTFEKCHTADGEDTTCPETCYGTTCDWWYDYNSYYSCSVMEGYGCNCDGCDCGVVSDNNHDANPAKSTLIS